MINAGEIGLGGGRISKIKNKGGGKKRPKTIPDVEDEAKAFMSDFNLSLSRILFPRKKKEAYLKGGGSSGRVNH